KITNVAAGTIGTGSTDAVNGGQIQAAGDSLASNVLGGNAKYENNDFTMSNVGGTGENNINDAIASANTAANAGWNVSGSGANEANIGPNGKVDFVGDSNITVAQTGVDDDGKIGITLNPDLDVDSVKTGNSTLDNSGLFVTDADAINPQNTTIGAGSITLTGGTNSDVVLGNNGLDNGGNKIVNVDNGLIATGSQDAVNGGQIQAAGDSLASNVLGGNAKYENNDFTMSNVGGTGENNINDAIASANTAANAGWNVSGSGANEANIGPNGKVDFVGDSNITVAQTGVDDDGKIGITLNPDLDVDSVKTGNSTLDNSGLFVT
ncbi:hypothetical protein LEM72_13705, partial [Psychrobacter aquimaris]